MINPSMNTGQKMTRHETELFLRNIIKGNLDLFDKDNHDDEEVEKETVPFHRQRDQANKKNARR